LRCACRESIAFFIPFSPPVGNEPRTPGLTTPHFFYNAYIFRLFYIVIK